MYKLPRIHGSVWHVAGGVPHVHRPEEMDSRVVKNRKKRRGPEQNLPTPPPAPAMNAFEHLARLHALVDQVLEVRERSCKLFRRVRRLEMQTALRRLAADLEKCQNAPSFDEDMGFADSLLSAMLSGFDAVPRTSSVSRASSLARPGPSSSPERRRVSYPVAAEAPKNVSMRPRTSTDVEVKVRPALVLGQPKVSKWTRVKAAFKWEKAACNPSDGDPEPGGRFLRPPEVSAVSSEISGPSSPAGTISSASSFDDVCQGKASTWVSTPRRPARGRGGADASRRSRSLDGEALVLPMTLVGSQGQAKGEGRTPRTPWSKMKSMIQHRRDSLARPVHEDNLSTSSIDSDMQADHDERLPRARLSTESCRKVDSNAQKPPDIASRRLTPTLTITVPSSEELRCLSSPESVPGRSSADEEVRDRSSQTSPASSGAGILRGWTKVGSRSHPSKDEPLGTSPRMHRRGSKWDKVKRAFLTSGTSVPTSPSSSSTFFFETNDASAEGDSDEQEDATVPVEVQGKLGADFYQKLADWETLKAREATKSAREKDTENCRLLSEDQLTPEFKKKLEEWKKMSKTTPNTTSRRRIPDWPLWRRAEKTEVTTGLTEDFVKKMEEWRRIKAAARKDEEVKKIDEKQSKQFDRWRGLEDEEFRPLKTVLQTIETERQRSSKVHRVVGAPPENTQVLIHTSGGFFRFEGINRKFTRRLYEWEKSQGINPELSTFRLLDPLSYGVAPCTLASTDAMVEDRARRILSRSKSLGSVRVGSWGEKDGKSEHHRPSTLSLNDVRHLETRTCIIASSVPTIDDEEDVSEDMALEDFELEPEAMIVDIEDVIEETASPLAKFQPHQTPIYSVASSETTSIAIPLGTVTARHESSPVILIEPGESHPSGVAGGGEDGKHAFNDGGLTEIQISTKDSHLPKALVNRLPELRQSARISREAADLSQMVITVASDSRPRRPGLKTRRLTDSQVGYAWQKSSLPKAESPEASPRCQSPSQTPVEDFLTSSNRSRITINADTLNKIVVPTSSGTLTTSEPIPTSPVAKKDNIESSQDVEDSSTPKKDDRRDPRNVFVKTKRIVFSPFRRESKVSKDSLVFRVDTTVKTEARVTVNLEKERREVPQSPIPSRKEYKSLATKDTAPGIRMMIKKYNAAVTSASVGNYSTAGSGTSSGSGSPIWRSPVSERRLRNRMEKYQEEVAKALTSATSRSRGLSHRKTLPKDLSVDLAIDPDLPAPPDPPKTSLKAQNSPEIRESSSSRPSSRTRMLQKAKEEFLAGPQAQLPSDNEPTRSQDTVGLQKSLLRLDLTKSASAGMINVDPDTFERLRQGPSHDSEVLSTSQNLRGPVSKGSGGRLHQLANRFRRVRNRKGKDKDFGSMSTVSMLCRQSLLVDIADGSKSCPTTPSPPYECNTPPCTTEKYE